MFILTDVSKYWGSKKIFSGVNITVMDGDRVGIVGPNASGKTTLLKLIAGLIEPDEGSVQIEKGKKLGLLKQEIKTQSDKSVMNYLKSTAMELESIEEKKLILLEKLQKPDEHAADKSKEKIIQEISSLEEHYRLSGGYDFKFRAEKVLAGLGFRPEELNLPVNALSGGMMMRLELARLLLEEPDALLLDEPTNHLDIQSMEWLEKYLENFKGCLVIVSHDREFLNKMVSQIASLQDETVRLYKGNYDRYREVRKQEIELAWKKYREQQEKIAEIKEFIARNRVRKDRAKVVQARIKMLEKMEITKPPSGKRTVTVQFPQPERSGSPVINLQNITMKFKNTVVLKKINLSVLRGEKVAIIGPNGSGKTTLLKIMAGQLSPSEGTVTIGANVTVDYYAQHQIEALSPDLTVLEEMTSISNRNITLQTIRDILGAFLFSSDEDINKKVENLSGGEKSRLALAKMMLKPANLLLMDEPTNHLDIDSREILEQALSTFTGTLIFVSHDRKFINAIATRLIELKGGEISDFSGNYDYYEWKIAQNEKSEKTEGSDNKYYAEKLKPGEKEKDRISDKTSIGKKRKDKTVKKYEAEMRNLIYQKTKPLQDEMKKIEDEIETLEKQQKERKDILSNPSICKSPEEIKTIGIEFSLAAKKIDELIHRWEEINQKIEKIKKGELPVHMENKTNNNITT